MLCLLAAVAALSVPRGSAAVQSGENSPHSQIGFAEVDVTPPEPLPLGGYTERRGKIMDPGGEPLFCRTIFLRRGETKVAIVSVEMLTIPESLYREVSARIPKDVRLFLASTHTHCAPDSQMLNDRMTFAIPGIATYKRRWLKWYADKIANCVTEAEGAAKPNSTFKAFSTSIDLNRNRRKGAPPDKTFTNLTFGPFGIEHYAAHPTLYGPEWNKTNGDWPGAVAKGGQNLVLLGPIGDVSPKSAGATSQDQVAAFAGKLRSAMSATVPRRELKMEPLRFVTVPIALDPVTPHPGFAKTYQVPDALANTVVKQFAPTEAGIAAVRIGKVAIVGVPGEPTAELGERIVAAGKKIGFAYVLPVSHVDGWIGYILAPKDYDKGGYEATLSFHGRLTGERVVAAAIRALHGIGG